MNLLRTSKHSEAKSKNDQVSWIFFRRLILSDYRSRQKHAEILNDAFSVEEVVGTDQEVPAQCSEPRQIVRPVHYISNVDDLVETLDLYA